METPQPFPNRRAHPSKGVLSSERGFSLVMVLMALVVITLVSSGVVYTSGADQLAASAKQRASVARQVAEAGLNHYAAMVQPSWVPNQLPMELGGGEEEEAGGGFSYTDPLEGVNPFFEQVLPTAPPGFSASYVVWGGSQIDDGAQIIIEGRVHPEGDTTRIVGRSRISVVVVMTSGTDGYSGTIGWTPRNTGVIGGGQGEGYAGW